MNSRKETLEASAALWRPTRRDLLCKASVGAALPALMAAALQSPAKAQTKTLSTLVVAIQEGDTRTWIPRARTS